MSLKSTIGVSGYSLSCNVRRRYPATTPEDMEDIVFAAVIFRVCRLVEVL
jgi:hypothetical protein